jgi:hypothetical protein
VKLFTRRGVLRRAHSTLVHIAGWCAAVTRSAYWLKQGSGIPSPRLLCWAGGLSGSTMGRSVISVARVEIVIPPADKNGKAAIVLATANDDGSDPWR